MPLTFEKSVILRRLAELDRRDPGRDIFGSWLHQYKLNPPLPTSVVEAFEGLHGISLPEDYRSFITEEGNGGAGPYYGLCPFGKYGYSPDFFDWDDAGFIGDLSKPFSFNTTTTVVNGAIPICHMGCGYLQWLAIRGEQRGFVWDDLGALGRGMTPVLGASGNPAAFGEWYMGWVNHSIRESAEGR
jgi:hypothetical protein